VTTQNSLLPKRAVLQPNQTLRTIYQVNRMCRTRRIRNFMMSSQMALALSRTLIRRTWPLRMCSMRSQGNAALLLWRTLICGRERTTYLKLRLHNGWPSTRENLLVTSPHSIEYLQNERNKWKQRSHQSHWKSNAEVLRTGWFTGSKRRTKAQAFSISLSQNFNDTENPESRFNCQIKIISYLKMKSLKSNSSKVQFARLERSMLKENMAPESESTRCFYTV